MIKRTASEGRDTIGNLQGHGGEHLEESLSTDDEIGLPASRDGETLAGGLYAGGNQGDFALAGGGEVERVSNGQVQRRTGRDVRSPTIGQPGRLNPYVGVTGLEVDGEGVVDVTVVPNFPVDGPCIVPSPCLLYTSPSPRD